MSEKIRVIEIHGENRFEKVAKVREACRGIVVSEGKILLTYEVNTDQWFIPGGGLEQGENLEICCVRELAEETGYLIDAKKCFLTIHEYYEEWLFTNHYFVCEIVGETARQLTEREVLVGLEPRWIPLETAMEIFSQYPEYAKKDEMKRGAYLREYRALQSFIGNIQ